MTSQRFLFGLLQRRTFVLPTWRGWLALLLIAAGTVTLAARSVHGFLAMNAPVPGGILVVEGWSPDFIFEGALAEYRRNSYEMVCATGGPIEVGSPFRPEKTFADFAKLLLEKMGIPSGAVHSVPAERTRKDRTWASALALRRWMQERGLKGVRVNVVGNDTHSRRTWMIFDRALRDIATVGVVNFGSDSYEPDRWWASSEGFRVVTGELIAWCYARFLFHPPVPEP